MTRDSMRAWRRIAGTGWDRYGEAQHDSLHATLLGTWYFVEAGSFLLSTVALARRRPTGRPAGGSTRWSAISRGGHRFRATLWRVVPIRK